MRVPEALGRLHIGVVINGENNIRHRTLPQQRIQSVGTTLANSTTKLPTLDAFQGTHVATSAKASRRSSEKVVCLPHVYAGQVPRPSIPGRAYSLFVRAE